MKTEIPVEQLLRWRLTLAANEAPPPPRAARLLELARPWWETWPEQFQAFVARLDGIQIAYGHAMAELPRPRGGHPVPALLVCGGEEFETSVRVLYLQVRDGHLRLRFQLEGAPAQGPQGQVPATFEATFVGEKNTQPLLSALATASVDREYRVDAVLGDAFARSWEALKVTDRMPFRLILRAPANDG